jgi:hypothetical protein
VHASEAQHAVGREDLRSRKPTGTARVHLVSTAEELGNRCVDVIDAPVGHQACSVAELGGPPSQRCVEAGHTPPDHDCAEPEAIDLSRELADTVLGRARAQILTVAAEPLAASRQPRLPKVRC